MMRTKISQVRLYVVQPACKAIGMWSQAAENLVLGTGNAESQYEYVDQVTPGPGPAYGWWQMEKATHDDLWATYLSFQSPVLQRTLRAMTNTPDRMIPEVETFHWNMMYAAAMCRIKYRRIAAPIPAADDAAGMAAYWKQWYNTPLGAGTADKALPYFQEVIA